MQGLLTWKTEHLKESYKKLIFILSYTRLITSNPRKAKGHEKEKEGVGKKCKSHILLTYNTSIIPKVKIGYILEKVEQFIPSHFKCFKCHKYGHHKERLSVMWKVWPKGPTPEGRRLSQQNELPELPRKPSSIFKILRHIQKKIKKLKKKIL